MGDGAQMTVAAIRGGQRAAVVMMLTRQANGLATAASSSAAAPARLPKRSHTNAHSCTCNKYTHAGMHKDPGSNDKDVQGMNGLVHLQLMCLFLSV